MGTNTPLVIRLDPLSFSRITTLQPAYDLHKHDQTHIRIQRRQTPLSASPKSCRAGRALIDSSKIKLMVSKPVQAQKNNR